ncbi:HXXXD-type acyl-transferase family protein [Prunus dulcis]|uniref:HXXXD-type acyl-transferase family protein n=1 Tax=Prunus dulcis TaxID=3755 RepID=A0A4Y1RV63_PRUDU|nr:HXXXD-type acyl-transferase family protein [Prunus dulcis]
MCGNKVVYPSVSARENKEIRAKKHGRHQDHLLKYSKSSSHNTRAIELTPWDLQLLLVDPIQKGLLFHKPKNFSQNIQHLKASLSRTLDFFPPLAGRLATIEHDEDNALSFFINCNNAGVLFVHAKADGVTLSDVKDSLYVPQDLVNHFFPLNGVKNFQGTSKPLLAVQVTELADGIFIGCTINHTVVDGTSFWHFFNSWSEISRGSSDHVSKSLFFNVGFRMKSIVPFEFPSRNLRIKSLEKVAQLKAKASAEIEIENTNTKISSLQAVLAHLWRSIIRGSKYSSDEETSYRLLIGARPRMKPPLPQQYFGNAVQAGTVTMKAGEVLERGLGFVAWEMNKMVALHTEEKLRSFLECWVQEPKLLTEDNMAANALVTSSSPRFNVYGNDFGWGRPVGVRSGAGNKSHGKITVFAGVEEGSIDIEVCLLAETLEAMGNDSEFMDVVTLTCSSRCVANATF